MYTVQIRRCEITLAMHLAKKLKSKAAALPRPLHAYVTFEDSVGAQRALQLYRDTWYGTGGKCRNVRNVNALLGLVWFGLVWFGLLCCVLLCKIYSVI
jgi:hypothetical protein